VRAHREVLLASAILVGVLAAIDSVSLGEPRLVLSLGPLVFVLMAALVPVGRLLAIAWAGVFLLLAALRGDARLAGLAYPALAFLVLLEAKRRSVKA
jgi:hypothetical protein